MISPPADSGTPQTPAQTAATMRLIAGAMAGGIAMLCAVVVFMFLTAQPRPETEQALRLVETLSLVNGVFGALSYPLSLLASRYVEREASPAGRAQTAMILRLAPREGGALLGCVACLVATTSGVLRGHPLFWLNLLTPGVFVLTTALNLPTEQHLQ